MIHDTTASPMIVDDDDAACEPTIVTQSFQMPPLMQQRAFMQPTGDNIANMLGSTDVQLQLPCIFGG